MKRDIGPMSLFLRMFVFCGYLRMFELISLLFGLYCVQIIYTMKKTKGLRMSLIETESWLTLKEICYYLSVSDDTLYRLIKYKNFPAFKIGNRWKGKKSQIDQWIAKNSSSPKDQEVK